MINFPMHQACPENIRIQTVDSVSRVAAVQLCRFLGQNLPALSTNWWPELVLPNLTDQQRFFVTRRGIADLSGLDLAALLRILERNWAALAEYVKWVPEIRNYVFEMKTVRNTWMHSSVAVRDCEDVYRDLDTLLRFLSAIQTPSEILDRIRMLKNDVNGSNSKPIAGQNHEISVHTPTMDDRGTASLNRQKPAVHPRPSEADIEAVLQRYPELIEEGLTLIGRQITVQGRRIDLLFRDSNGRQLIIELKKGVVTDAHVGQLIAYEGLLLQVDIPTIRVMLVAGRVPPNFQQALTFHGISWKEIRPTDIRDFLRDRGEHEWASQFEVDAISPSATKPIQKQQPEITLGDSRIVLDVRQRLDTHPSLEYRAQFNDRELQFFRDLLNRYGRELVDRQECCIVNADARGQKGCPNFFNKNVYCQTGVKGVYRIPVELLGQQTQFKDASPEIVRRAWMEILRVR